MKPYFFNTLLFLCFFVLQPAEATGQGISDTLTRIEQYQQQQEIIQTGQKEKEIRIRFYFFVLGFSLLLAFLMFFRSAVYDRDKSNLYCALMFLCNGINVFLWTDTLPFTTLFGLKPGAWGLWFNQTVPIVLMLLYREFLNTRQERPVLYRFMTIVIVLAFIFNMGMLFQFYLPSFKSYIKFEKLFEIVFLSVQFILPIAFLKYWQHPIFRYAAWSSWVVAGSFILYFLWQWEYIFNPLPQGFEPANILFIALMIDGILFLCALTLRDHQTALEKTRLEQQAATNELKALHAQMNPHFIFNALNSIKSFTLNNDTEGANFYLTKFSKLIRQVLDNSRNERISLKQELDTLRLYLDMEKMRVGDKFDYLIRLEEEVEEEFIELPPMLIQPYIENAIWHGLMHKEGKGLLEIDIHIKNQSILVVNITDNGIGRAKAAELKSKTGTSHKSYGMKITAERVDIIKRLYNLDATIRFEDLQKPDGSAAGTKVIVEIPI